MVHRPPEGLPSEGSDAYRETVRAFYHGLASVEVGLLDDARTQFLRAAALAPAEPAIAANIAVAYVRSGDDAAAAAHLDIAEALAPDSSEIALLQGQFASFRGRFDVAVTHYRRAADLSAENLKARFALALELERTGDDHDAAEAQQSLEEILAREPENIAVLVVHVRLALGRGDGRAATDTVERLTVLSTNWPVIAQTQLDGLATAIAKRDFQRARTASVLLRNVLLGATIFLESQAGVSVSAEMVADPLYSFLRLPSPSSTAAPVDDTLAYTVEPLGRVGSLAQTVAGIVLSHEATTPAVIVVDEQQIRRIDTNESFGLLVGNADRNTPVVLRPFDWNSDFRVDLAVLSGGGLGLFEQTAHGTFRAVPLISVDGDPIEVAAANGVWVADIEMDGDLDILLGTIGEGPELLRNNGDGSWASTQPFPTVTNLVGFAWGDLDQDGDPDAVVLDAEGRVNLFANRQGGQFTDWLTSGFPTRVVALALGDLMPIADSTS